MIMNFKDAYKSYNDEIKGDPKVLETILNGKKESKKFMFIRPSFVGAMAAMVVIAVSIFGFNSINNNPVKPQKTYIAARNTNDNNTKNIPEAFIVPDNTSVKPEDANINSEKNNSIVTEPQNPTGNKKYPSKNSATKKTQDTPLTGAKKDDISVDNAVSEPLENSAVYEITPATEDTPNTKNEQVASYETEVVSTTNPNGDEGSDCMPAALDETVTTADCYEYFGFDVTQKADLPEDMSFGGNVIIDSKKSEETGEMEYCSFSIDAYSNKDVQRTLDVCVTKQNTPIADTDYKQSYTSTETGEVTGGKSVSGNVSVEVNSQNVTQTEVEELIDSLN